MRRRVSLFFVIFSFLLTSGCLIKGTVYQDGDGVQGVNISIDKYYSDGYRNYRTAITGINGEYKILLPWGRYRIALASSEFCSHDWLSKEVVVAFQGFFITNRIDWTLEESIYNGNYYIKTANDIEKFYKDGNGYTYITGNLIIKYTGLTNLDGLECLSGIGGSLIIRNNAKLENIEGLNFLLEVHNRLTIVNNPKLCTSDAESLLDNITLDGIDTISNNDNC